MAEEKEQCNHIIKMVIEKMSGHAVPPERPITRSKANEIYNLPCFLCKRWFKDSTIFFDHLVIHCASIYCCPSCNEWFGNLNLLLQHSKNSKECHLDEDQIMLTVELNSRWGELYFAASISENYFTNKQLFYPQEWCQMCCHLYPDLEKVGDVIPHFVEIETNMMDFLRHLLTHLTYFRYICKICLVEHESSHEDSDDDQVDFEFFYRSTIPFPNAEFILDHIEKYHDDFSLFPPNTIIFERFMFTGFIELCIDHYNPEFEIKNEYYQYNKEQIEELLYNENGFQVEEVTRPIEIKDRPKKNKESSKKVVRKNYKNLLNSKQFEKIMKRVEERNINNDNLPKSIFESDDDD